MNKSDILIDNLLKLEEIKNKDDVELLKQIITEKNKLLTDKELDNINNLLTLIINDKSIISMIKVNCMLIYEDGKIDCNDIQYMIKLSISLVELFNNYINFNVDVNTNLVSNIIEYLLILFIIPKCENKKLVLNMIDLIMGLLRTVIYPFKKCNILCCK